MPGAGGSGFVDVPLSVFGLSDAELSDIDGFAFGYKSNKDARIAGLDYIIIVPEPPSYGLLGCVGLLAFSLCRRVRRAG